jgi:hypothetical protein
VLILDACRDNPLARNLARSMGTRAAAIGKGLAAQESGAGTLISYSTQPGNVALDGTGRNSPFATALLKHLPGEGRGLTATLINVRNDVMAATAKRQVPWEHSALTNELVLAKAAETGEGNKRQAQAKDNSQEKTDTGKIEQERDAGQKTAAVPQDASPPPNVIFRDGFDGDALGAQWTVRNEDKSGYVVENGAMLLVTSRNAGYSDPPTVLSAPNALHLSGVALTGDWDFAVQFKPDFSRVGAALVQIGLVDGKTIPIRANFDLETCSEGHKLRLVLVTGGAQETTTEVELATSCSSDRALTKEDFGKLILNLAKVGATMVLHKRGRDYYVTMTGPMGGKTRTQPVTLLRASGVPAVGVRHDSNFGQTIVSLDEVTIMKAQ